MTARRVIETALALALAILLTACGGSAAVQTSSGPAKTPFGISLEDSEDSQGWSEQHSGERLDVIVALFDPNIPADSDDYEKLQIWPELRRTESTRFAVALRDEIQSTNAFGSVRTMPDTEASGDLFVRGKILKSNGEDIEISVQVHDISGARWMKKTYKHRVKEYHWQNIRQAGKDPYRPVFEKAARDIAKLLKKKSAEDVAQIRAISEIQFASVLSYEAFGHHLEVKNRRVKLVSLPAVDDPRLVRTRGARVLDGLFMDKMQDEYTDFVSRTNDSYVAWQEHSMESAKAEREAQSRAGMQALGGMLLLFGAAAAADSNDDLGSAAAIAAAAGGIKLMQDSFASSSEGKFHRDNLAELGSDINFEVAPQVIQLEESTLTLQGDVRSQYRQWQTFLKQLYDREVTPAVQL